jgi:tetratricopeptide (TPR) repeat protein
VTVSAAGRAMPVLYRRVADGEDLAAAVTAARRDLQEHRGRRAYFGQELDLEDWVLPVMFGQRPLRIDLRPMTDPELAGFYERQAVVAEEPATEYGFVGRDLDIQVIEHRLLATEGGGQLLVQGMAGAGKSTLLAHVAWWWQRTGLVDRVFRFSYEDRAWTAGQIVRQIRSVLLSPAEHARADALSEAAQAEQVAGLLRAARHLLILDNAESITAAPAAIPHALDAGERDKLKAFLARLRGGRTLVLLGSRGTEDWLTAGPGPGIYPLPGLDAQAASLLVDKILGRHGATRWLDDDAERRALQDLVTVLGGYPLPLTVVLPVLATVPPSQVLAELRAGGPGADPAGLIRRAIEYSHGKLDPALQNSLQLLAPFTAVIGTGPVLDRYQELLSRQEAVQALGTIDLAAALVQAVSVGLAAPHPQLSYLVTVQPVLPWFLRSRLHDQPALAAATEQAHYQLYQDLVAGVLYQMLTSTGDPERRITGMAAAHAEYANLTSALGHGLRTGQPIRDLVLALNRYLDQAQQHNTRRQLLDAAIAAHPEPASQQQHGELAQLHNLAGQTALAQHRLGDADTQYQAALSLYQAAGERYNQAATYYQLGRVAQEQRRFGEAEASYRQALDIFLELGERYKTADVYHVFGSLALEQRRFADAEANYRQALDIYLESGDRHSAARTYHQLGRVAQEQRRFGEAEASYRQALDIKLEFGDRHSAALTYHNLGAVAQEQGRFTEAEASYRQALDIKLEFGDRHSAARTYHQLGMLAQEQQQFGAAEENYRLALDIRRESDPRAASSTATRLGIVLSQLGQHSEATAVLLYAAVSWRQEAGQWAAQDLQLLNQERTLLGPAEFTKLAKANIPADLANEFADAVKA